MVQPSHIHPTISPENMTSTVNLRAIPRVTLEQQELWDPSLSPIFAVMRSLGGKGQSSLPEQLPCVLTVQGSIPGKYLQGGLGNNPEGTAGWGGVGVSPLMWFGFSYTVPLQAGGREGIPCLNLPTI